MGPLEQTCLANLTKVPVKAGFPLWYSADGRWFTFDSGPGSDTAQVGRRLVKVWI
jgi:hypothetical protein